MKVRKKAKCSAEEQPPANEQATINELVQGLVSHLDFPPPKLSEAGKQAGLSSFPTKGLQERELLSVLAQLTEKLASLRRGAGALLEKFSPEGGPPADGGSTKESCYMEMKTQLMLSYLICLMYYLLLKVRGAPVAGHPVVDRIIWIRTLLQKLRPVDERLAYQMSKLLQWVDTRKKEDTATEAAPDPHALRPGVLALGVEDEEEEADAAEADAQDDGVYRPPRVSSVEYTGDHITEKDRAERDLEKTRERLNRSEFVRSLREEFTDAPVEVGLETRSAAAQRAMRKLAEREAYEEDNMTRLRTSKREQKEMRRLLEDGKKPSGVDSLADISDFRELAAELGGGGGRPGKGKGKGKGRGSGSALRDYQGAVQRAKQMRGVVEDAFAGRGGEDGGSQRGRGRGKKRKAEYLF